ncbi:unnamed protein product [Cladocopium goreaui]|uniref:EF-hand domain-containing protein n=1 Tax=Cladocopium goreaui TaxID=2562237 RepID=A0A9P1FSQ8_9DINO|nr:unnamed protein product [Cladocopium goreaui]
MPDASKAEKLGRNGWLSLAPWPRLKIWGPALVIFACVAAAAVTPAWPVWFWYHPAAMLLGYVALMGNAVLVKKIGGLRATKIHGYLMGAGSIVTAFGWYVIYSNKEVNGKPHLTTWHGISGLFILLGTYCSAVAGAGLLDPHIGMMKASKTVRYFHSNGGRILLAAAFACCVLGWSTVQKQALLPVVLFTIPVMIFMKVLI